MQFVRYVILPVSIIYGLITLIRNKFFDWGIISSKSFNIPVISVGNLNMGGTGKTPFTEYIINLLHRDYRVAVLSRGYKRKTRGYILASDKHSWIEIGDEPKQIINKFPEVQFAVDEKRKRGIKNLMDGLSRPDVIILDDAFQHRSVKPGLSILLTEYYNLFTADYLLPTGGLRETPSGAQRADIIVVTKCPSNLSPITKQSVLRDINPKENQILLYSYIGYSNPVPLNNVKVNLNDENNVIFLIAGIANTFPLEQHLKRYSNNLIIKTFPDHYCYKIEDWKKIKANFESINHQEKFICITEKDKVKLDDPEINNLIKDLPIYYIPIEIEFHKEDELMFNKIISDYVRKNKTNS